MMSMHPRGAFVLACLLCWLCSISSFVLLIPCLDRRRGAFTAGIGGAAEPSSQNPAAIDDHSLGSAPDSVGHDPREDLSLAPLLTSINSLSVKPCDAERVFHGRDGWYGPASQHLTLDFYPPVWLLTSFATELSDDQLELVISEISKLMKILGSNGGGGGGGGGDDNDDDDVGGQLNFVYQFRSGASGVSPGASKLPTNDAEPVASYTRLVKGKVPDPHVVTERGMKFFVQLLRGQNHGLFLDMAAGRAWVRDRVRPGYKVLNMFAYTCAFSVAVLSGGASEVVNIDMARGPLKVGQRNHGLNGFGGRSDGTNTTGAARFLSHNIFKSWGKMNRYGPYDLIIVDPPSFQKGSFVAKKDYAKVLRRLSGLLVPDGIVLLCLNAPELDTAFVKSWVTDYAPDLEIIEQVANPASFPAADPERALKVFVFVKKTYTTRVQPNFYV